jgi:hypothetical protein
MNRQINVHMHVHICVRYLNKKKGQNAGGFMKKIIYVVNPLFF